PGIWPHHNAGRSLIQPFGGRAVTRRRSSAPGCQRLGFASLDWNEAFQRSASPSNVDHGVAVSTNYGEVFKADLSSGSRGFRKGFLVVNVRESFPQLPVASLKIETAARYFAF